MHSQIIAKTVCCQGNDDGRRANLFPEEELYGHQGPEPSRRHQIQGFILSPLQTYLLFGHGVRSPPKFDQDQRNWK